jgi:hypothetical protein
MDKIKSIMPAGSIISYSVGNEPDMYTLKTKEGLKGAAEPKNGNWLGWVAAAGGAVSLHSAASVPLPLPVAS